MSNTKDTFTKAMTTLHRSVYRMSGGRIFKKGFGMPVVILTTTGRKSGKKRETMLTSPIQQDDGTVVLVASYGGDDRNPAWFLNLGENPDVELEIHGETQQMTARTATTDEKAELWPDVVGSYKGYGGYQEKTDRDIPLVLLSPGASDE
jgi:deazaflavin-dependent oxidoreductase (nitroreductase family)